MAEKEDGPPRFEGKDFQLWRFNFLLWMEERDLEFVLDGTERRPGSPPPASSGGEGSSGSKEGEGVESSTTDGGKEKAKATAASKGKEKMDLSGEQLERAQLEWDKKDKKAFNKLCRALQLQPEMIKLIMNLKGKQGAAAIAWKRINDKNLRKGLLNLLVWRRKFFNLERNYDSGETMTQYLQRVDEMVQVLYELDYEVSEKDMIYTALSGIDAEANDALLEYLHLEQAKWTKDYVWDVLVSREERKEASKRADGGMGAAEKSKWKQSKGGSKVQDKGSGGGFKKGNRQCLVPGCTMSHSWKYCWSRKEGWKPPNYEGEVPPVVRPAWVEEKMKKNEWKKGKGMAAKAHTKEESDSDGYGFGACLFERALAGELLSSLDVWVVDSGATKPMTPRRDLFTTYTPVPNGSRSVIVGTGHRADVAGVGTITLVADDGRHLCVKGVLHVPALVGNLLSCPHLAKQRLYTTMTNKCCELHMGDAVVMRAPLKDDQYLLPVHVSKAKDAGHVAGDERMDASMGAKWGTAEKASLDLLHLRLGHVNKKQLMKVLRDGQLRGVEACEGKRMEGKCPDCAIGKMRRSPFPTSSHRAAAPLRLVHTDVCGPMRTKTKEGARYILTFLDDYSRASWVVLLKSRDEVAGHFKKWTQMAERQFEHKVKRLRSDRGGEYVGKAMQQYLDEQGILHNLTTPYTPQQNGRAERLNRTLVELARTILHHAGLDNGFWGAAVTYANWVRNRMGSKCLGGESPYRVLYGEVPDVSMARVWGCMAQYWVPDAQRSKLDPKARWGVFIGVAEKSKAWILWDVESHKVVESRDVLFHEGLKLQEWKQRGPSTVGTTSQSTFTASIFDGTWDDSIDEEPAQPDGMGEEEPGEESGDPDEEEQQEQQPRSPPHMNQEEQLQPQEEQPQQQTPPPKGVGDDHEQHMMTPPTTRLRTLLQQQSRGSPLTPRKRVTWEEKLRSLEHGEATPLRRSDRTRHPPDWYTPGTSGMHAQVAWVDGFGPHEVDEACDLFGACEDGCVIGKALVSQVMEPRSVREALSCEDAPKWKVAMQEEYNSHMENESWVLVDRPKESIVLSCGWIFKVKYNPDGTVERYKCRLVAKGYRQKKGLHYEEVFSPVGKQVTLKSLLAVAAHNGLHIHHMDVKTAFLNGKLKDRLYMEQPESFNDGTGRVCLLESSIYGLVQAPREWYLKLDEVLLECGFTRSECDPALYHRVTDQGTITLFLYVDDLLLFGSDLKLLEQVKGMLSKKFKMKDLGEVSYYLGMQVSRNDKGIFVSQQRYIEVMLEKYGLSDANPVETPLPHKFNVHAHDVDRVVSGDKVKEYQSMVGSLMYASTTTHPEIAYAVSQLSKVQASPRLYHLKVAKRVMKYLKGVMHEGILFPSGGDTLQLVGYSDADYAGDKANCHSHSGYVFCINGAAISWKSQKQPVVALSTTESEYISLCKGVQEAVWLKRLLAELGHEQKGGVPMFVDNQSAIALAQNACLHGRTKHMQVRWHFIREMVEAGEVALRWCPTLQQAVDVLTKPLPEEGHKTCMKLMGMCAHVKHEIGKVAMGLVLLAVDGDMMWVAPPMGMGE